MRRWPAWLERAKPHSRIAAPESVPLSFVLDRNAREARMVLRSRWQTGRRFDLARLIGDRVIVSGGALHPATRTYTYRQKAQRSFAAELLSPFEAVDDMLAGDYPWRPSRTRQSTSMSRPW